MGLFGDSGGDLVQVRSDLARLEQRVAALERALSGRGLTPAGGPPASDLIPEEVVLLARQGHKIQAIKALRQHSGLGLAQAKQVVDEL